MKAINSLFCVALMATACAGQTLECFRCDLGFGHLCYTTKTNCSDGEQCFVGIGSAASVYIKMMGCLPKKDCNKTTAVEFRPNMTMFTMTKQCCDENYCNGCPALLMAPLTLVVLTVVPVIGLF